jgi:adenine-specific DNA-methyltransferase
MPTLHWIGKEKVVNHHRDVPYRILDHQYSFEAEAGARKEPGSSGNKIIHGDNLEALKSLLPEYEGKVKCIYIDPPYNTGNEEWIYNDNVNDPKIKKWLGQLVGKEAEDLSRHDKWLCMMYPRLKLLHKLLASDGAIFISIDDNEQANLKLVMDEIFGAGNFLANISWQKKQSPQNDAINFSDMHDFIIIYSKRKKASRFDNSGFNRNLIPKTIEQNARYKNPDSDERGDWASGDCSSNKTRFERPNLYFPIINPLTKQEVFPSESRVWRFESATFSKLLSEKRIYFGKDGKSFPRLKLFLSDVAEGVVPSTWWTREFAGDNQEGRRLLRDIFGEVDNDFSTPKPTKLIERILQIASNHNDIILDSFAGSGTAAHAVLNLNKQDGGNRKFIYPGAVYHNGVIELTSSAAFENLLSQLDNAYELHNADFFDSRDNMTDDQINAYAESVGFDEFKPLRDFETYFGFNSLRNKVAIEIGTWMNSTDPEANYPEENYSVDDEIEQTLLNHNGQVKIAGTVYAIALPDPYGPNRQCNQPTGYGCVLNDKTIANELLESGNKKAWKKIKIAGHGLPIASNGSTFLLRPRVKGKIVYFKKKTSGWKRYATKLDAKVYGNAYNTVDNAQTNCDFREAFNTPYSGLKRRYRRKSNKDWGIFTKAKFCELSADFKINNTTTTVTLQ